ncbi:MAG: hypothetical protein K0S67_231 [Nitrososphaeraceae archaeon]|jgi:ferritin-like metal-binding protein YciE|nr:hypothetical protein [Nitrososphaeraceae archaeon]MDF2767874.1 hypothetical protein [Nitrososphaeraceae archaeon]
MSKLNQTDIMKQKFILELNGALAMENAGIERLQVRIAEVSLQEAKQQLQHHQQESKEHQKRLQQLISSIGGSPTQERLGLPLPSYPQTIKEMMNNSMTEQEWELKKAEEDMIVENAEVTCYLMLIQKAQMAGGVFFNAVEPLSQNMKDEEHMVDWIKTNSPGMLAQLWPKIQSSVATSSSS